MRIYMFGYIYLRRNFFWDKWMRSAMLRRVHHGYGAPTGYPWAWWSRAWRGSRKGWCLRKDQPGRPRTLPANKTGMEQRMNFNNCLDPRAFISNKEGIHFTFMSGELVSWFYLKSSDGGRLETKIGLEVLGDFTDQTLERELADQELSGFLISAKETCS